MGLTITGGVNISGNIQTSALFAPGQAFIGNVSYTGTSGQANINFLPPNANGSTAITSHAAISTPGNISNTIAQASAGTITLTGLSAGTSYTFQVFAINSVGNGIRSTASLPFIAGNVPATPSAPTAVQGYSSSVGVAAVDVTYTAPANNGPPIISHTAISSPGNVTATVNQASSGVITVTGLTAGTAYTFVVKATNLAGGSANSAASGSVTPSIPQQAQYTTAGTYTWVAPTGVTTVSAVAIGGGGGGLMVRTMWDLGTGYGGGGGGLGYANVSVTAGNPYTVVVGAQGDGGSGWGGPSGGQSYFNSTASVAGNGGDSGTNGAGGGFVGNGGGNGGNGAIGVPWDGNPPNFDLNGGGGGGGAGGYSGKGGNGGTAKTAGQAGAGGGGGGSGGGSWQQGWGPLDPGGAGGVGLYGAGPSGAGGTAGAVNVQSGVGGGGSSGTAGGTSAPFAYPNRGGNGGTYGGGGGMAVSYPTGTSDFGGSGAVRIIWGSGRHYPSTSVGNAFYAAANRPAAPSQPTVAITNTNFVITYTAPSNGGFAISTHNAVSSPGGYTASVSQASSGTITFNNSAALFTPGTGYTFTVFANNIAGSGTSSVASASTNYTNDSANLPPAPPSAVAFLANNSIGISYMAAANGTFTNTSHMALSTPGNIAASVAQAGPGGFSYPANVFIPGTSYTFDVFAVSSAGRGTGVTTNAVVFRPNPYQIAYVENGTYTWIAPTGVSTVSVVAVGAGGASATQAQSGAAPAGAGGGGLGYRNSISVSAGSPYTVVVGASGPAGGTSGQSYFNTTATVAGNGGSGTTQLAVGGSGGGYVGNGGGFGGAGGPSGGWSNYSGGGGGGAGGYSGNGGNGGNGSNAPGQDGQGGGGGGGAGGNHNHFAIAGSGGGVGIWGLQSPGKGGVPDAGAGTGGSLGGNGAGGYHLYGGVWNTGGPPGGVFGGGGTGGVDPYNQGLSGNGGGGAVRIIWPSPSFATRTFPSTNTQDVSS